MIPIRAIEFLRDLIVLLAKRSTTIGPSISADSSTIESVCNKPQRSNLHDQYRISRVAATERLVIFIRRHYAAI